MVCECIHFQERLTIRSRTLIGIDRVYRNDCNDLVTHDLSNYYERVQRFDLFIEKGENAILKFCDFLRALDNIRVNLTAVIKDILKSWENGKSSSYFSISYLNSIIERIRRIYDARIPNRVRKIEPLCYW